VEPAPARDARTIRLALVGVALLVLLAIVALASRSGFGHASASRPTPGYVSWAMSVFLIVFVLMIPISGWLYLNQHRDVERRRQRSFPVRVVRGLLILFALMLLGFAATWLWRRGHLPNLSTLLRPSSGAAGGKGKQSTVAPYSPTFEWPVLWATLALLAVGGALLYRSWRRHGVLEPPAADGPTVAEELAVSIGEAIDDLEAEPDARVAVIAAYARMERVLGRTGIGRRPSETAIEYLRRVLGELSSNRDAVSRLTALFERAKFSRHEIDAPMKHEAIAALREIRDGLEAVPA
jgi:hypothetical protein